MQNNLQKRILSVILGIFLASAATYLNFFAPYSIKVNVEMLQIDKILHIIGGIFIVSLIEWHIGRASFWRVLGIVSLFFLSWKLFEFFIDLYWHYHYILNYFKLWAVDFTGDYIATVFGGLFYWLMIMYRFQLQKMSDQCQ